MYKRLLDRFNHPEHVLAAPENELLKVQGITPRLARAITTHLPSDTLLREMETIDRKNHQVVTYADADYPALLREIPDPPPFLFVNGTLSGGVGNMAVVGSRNATQYGIETTGNLCRALAYHKMTVVSGMALGIDTAAHLGAIAGKGHTIAVLGSGLDNIYPVRNSALFHQIAENGAVVSEFFPGTEPDAHHFPRRNRIISGMSLGTVVVEAAKKSGSLITARMAAEQNREVFAIPGSIQSHKSTGTHTLIKQGAKLVENVVDILEEFPYLLTQTTAAPLSDPVPDLSERARSVLGMLDVYPAHIDDIIRKTAMSPGTLSGILLELELAGRIRQMPGKYFCLANS